MNNTDLISVKDLKFSKVVSPTHKEIGVIDDVVIHQDSQRIAYAVLKMRGFMGFGDRRFPIPLGAFHVDTKEHKIILDVDRKKLKNAPQIDIEEVATFDYSEFLWKVYEYYDIKPYLTADKGDSDIKLSNTLRSRPATIRESRLVNSKFENRRNTVQDRNKTHYGF